MLAWFASEWWPGWLGKRTSDGRERSIAVFRLMDSCVRVAVDLNFWALFNGNTSGIHKVCADATIACFGPCSIDCAFSNSMHHIPTQSTRFYRDILVSLKSGGRFVGIETQGLLAKLALNMVLCMPRFAMPHSFRNIDDERNLLREWLRVPIEKRLTDAGIRSFDCNKTLFHTVYSFSKVQQKCLRSP